MKNVLTQLDMIHIQDKQADKISSGQKRSLSLGIAMLGNPQVKMKNASATKGCVHVCMCVVCVHACMHVYFI